mmetsp:Transcript_12729/g.32117  ORF Transcript_12729/g.32117 Transcript_12729/m.32117 type:complete len:336 (-) Transcript_12729:316-1323(-)
MRPRHAAAARRYLGLLERRGSSSSIVKDSPARERFAFQSLERCTPVPLERLLLAACCVGAHANSAPWSPAWLGAPPGAVSAPWPLSERLRPMARPSAANLTCAALRSGAVGSEAGAPSGGCGERLPSTGAPSLSSSVEWPERCGASRGLACSVRSDPLAPGAAGGRSHTLLCAGLGVRRGSGALALALMPEVCGLSAHCRCGRMAWKMLQLTTGLWWARLGGVTIAWKWCPQYMSQATRYVFFVVVGRPVCALMPVICTSTSLSASPWSMLAAALQEARGLSGVISCITRWGSRSVTSKLGEPLVPSGPAPLRRSSGCIWNGRISPCGVTRRFQR